VRRFRSRGTGAFDASDLASVGRDVVFEDGVRVFHPGRVHVGDNVYVGHDTILEAWHENRLVIGSDTWVGAGCHLHAAGGLEIGGKVGIGPGVRIITSTHRVGPRSEVILEAPLDLAAVRVGDGVDIGVGAVVLPGVTLGEGAQVGAGAVVTRDVPPWSVVAGVPARLLRER